MNGTVVIAEKIPLISSDRSQRIVEERLRKLGSGLNVSVHLEGFTSNGFPRVAVKGSDSEIYTELIKRKHGIAPTEASGIEVNDNFKAYTTGKDSKRQNIEVEIGPVSKHFRSEIVKEGLNAQLCDGKDIPLDRIVRTYCIQEGIPLFVRVTHIDIDRKRIEAWLSDKQANRFEEWRRQRFQRIIAVGGFRDKIREVTRFSGVERDVIDVEELAFMAHSIVCKLGTDAPGIIAKIGRHISGFKLYAFLPERVDRLRSGFSDAE